MLFYPSDSQRLKEMSGERRECFCSEIHKIINSNRDINKTMVGFQKWQVFFKVCSCHGKEIDIIYEDHWIFLYNRDAVFLVKQDFKPSHEKLFSWIISCSLQRPLNEVNMSNELSTLDNKLFKA